MWGVFIIHERKNRFYIAVVGAGFAIFAGIYRVFGSSRFTYGENGRIIHLNPEPIGVIVVTLLVAAVVVGLYQWYKRDRVTTAFSSMNEAEREQMLQLLLNEKIREDAIVGGKRKLLQESDIDQWAEENDWDIDKRLNVRR